jgi:hypothetical protein
MLGGHNQRMHHHNQTADDWAPLSERQREVLDFLLSVDHPGVTELRRQTEFALAKPWDCGCASIDLTVDQTRAPQASITASPAVEAESKERDDPLRVFDLLLWVKDGWLAGIELVEYGYDRHEDAPKAFRPPMDFNDPHTRSA